MDKTQNNNTTNPICRNCQHFLGVNPPSQSVDNTPDAWCSPNGKDRQPCTPYEDASKKICYSSKK